MPRRAGTRRLGIGRLGSFPDLSDQFALRNPEGQALDFHADVAITVSGKGVFKKALPIEHIHDPRTSGPTDTIQTGKGVAFVEVSGAKGWFSFTYPATKGVPPLPRPDLEAVVRSSKSAAGRREMTSIVSGYEVIAFPQDNAARRAP